MLALLRSRLGVFSVVRSIALLSFTMGGGPFVQDFLASLPIRQREDDNNHGGGDNDDHWKTGPTGPTGPAGPQGPRGR